MSGSGGLQPPFAGAWKSARPPGAPSVGLDCRGRSRQSLSALSSLFPNARRGRARVLRALFWCALVGLGVWLVATSWLRWVDPVIDFGREVYLPWRVLAGEHLGRDFIHPYGPFSVYANAGLMAVFGVSIRTLVFANLAIFCAIVVCLHIVLRRAFGFLPAAVATAFGVAGFGFPHYWGINNYTYAAPYSHEATHGMLALLGLLTWLGRPHGRPTVATGLGAGILLGLCCLTKSEYVLAGAAVVSAAATRFWRHRPTSVPVAKTEPPVKAGPATFTTGVLVGTLLVFLLAAGLLTLALPFADSAMLTANALLAPFLYPDYSKSAHVLRFLGADNLVYNLRALVLWGTGTVAALAVVALAARRIATRSKRWLRWVVGAAIGGLVIAAVYRIPWLFCGTAFPALLLAGAVILGRNLRARSRAGAPLSQRHWNQSLLVLAAVAMLARMAFDPTISHYGFFQALLAATWICGFLLGEWPAFATRSPWARRMLLAGGIVLLLGGAVSLVRTSLKFYAAKTTPIGEGADRIVGYSTQAYLMPELWELARRFVVSHSKPDETLLVIPEGISLNYWTRRRHPLRIIDLLPATLRLNRGDVVAELVARPPDWVVLVSRPNMEELGFKAYGSDTASGKAIVDWVIANYKRVAHDGTAPFAPGGVGIEIYRRNVP
jgi:hypothetical protein